MTCEEGLSISNLKGSTLEDKISSLITYFENIDKKKIGISLDGYKKMVSELNISIPNLTNKLKISSNCKRLRAKCNVLDYNIKPRDLLDLIDKNDLIAFIKIMESGKEETISLIF
jgi:hypothetical protein